MKDQNMTDQPTDEMVFRVVNHRIIRLMMLIVICTRHACEDERLLRTEHRDYLVQISVELNVMPTAALISVASPL
jgi:hypothetical protein